LEGAVLFPLIHDMTSRKMTQRKNITILVLQFIVNLFTLLCCIVLHLTAPYFTVVFSTLAYFTVLHVKLLPCSVFQITTQYFRLHLYFIVLYFTLFYRHLLHSVSRNSALGTETKLWATQSGVRSPAGEIDLSLLRNAQVDSGAHPASYAMDTGSLFFGVKRPRRETDNSLPSNAEVKNEWSYTFTLLAWFHGVYRDRLTIGYCTLLYCTLAFSTLVLCRYLKFTVLYFWYSGTQVRKPVSNEPVPFSPLIKMGKFLAITCHEDTEGE
jgi:hypothetical protein